MNTDAAKPADLHFQERFAGAYLRRRHSRNTSSPKGRMHMTTSLQANRWEMLPNTKEFRRQRQQVTPVAKVHGACGKIHRRKPHRHDRQPSQPTRKEPYRGKQQCRVAYKVQYIVEQPETITDTQSEHTQNAPQCHCGCRIIYERQQRYKKRN